MTVEKTLSAEQTSSFLESAPIQRHRQQIINWRGEVVVENIYKETPNPDAFEFTLREVRSKGGGATSSEAHPASMDTVTLLKNVPPEETNPQDLKESQLLDPKGIHYEATTPYRCIVWLGDTPGEAIGNMLRGIAELARSGALNPKNPDQMGVPPIQHVLEILSERLTWQMDRRRQNLCKTGLKTHPIDNVPVDVARDNEVISALATSIAALARVKDL